MRLVVSIAFAAVWSLDADIRLFGWWLSFFKSVSYCTLIFWPWPVKATHTCNSGSHTVFVSLALLLTYYRSVKPINTTFIICPIAIAYSMGQIIKSVCVCQSVYLSVCQHSHSRISWSIFTKIGTDVKTLKMKNEFEGSISHHPSPILSPNTHFRPRCPENACE